MEVAVGVRSSNRGSLIRKEAEVERDGVIEFWIHSFIVNTIRVACNDTCMAKKLPKEP